jgi:hypothetical protein
MHIFDTSPPTGKRQYAHENEHIIPSCIHRIYALSTDFNDEH